MAGKYQKGLISLIAPCYNGEKYVRGFLDAILNQTYREFEVIFVNDGSTDRSAKIAEEYVANFDKIGARLIILHKPNGGLGSAISYGLKRVKGEFLTWLGIDDVLYDTFFEKCVNFLNVHSDYAIVRPDGDYVSENSPDIKLPTIVSNVKDKFNPYIFWNAVNEYDFHFGYSFMRTAVFEKENGNLSIYESREGQNWQLLLPVLYRHKSGYIDEPLYKVLYRSESVSNRASTPMKRINQLKEYNRILVETIAGMPHIKEDDKSRALTSVNNRYAHKIFQTAILSGEYQTAKEYYGKLKSLGLLNKSESMAYRKKILRIEYWLYLKHELFW